MTVDLSTAFGRLRLKNPIGTASGTFGYGLEFTEYLDLAALGAISVKGLSRRPCHGFWRRWFRWRSELDSATQPSQA